MAPASAALFIFKRNRDERFYAKVGRRSFFTQHGPKAGILRLSFRMRSGLPIRFHTKCGIGLFQPSVA
jgi:hypothetical protein